MRSLHTSSREQYLVKDQDIFFKTLEEHEKLPLTSIQNSLFLYKNHLTESAAKEKMLIIEDVKTIKE